MNKHNMLWNIYSNQPPKMRLGSMSKAIHIKQDFRRQNISFIYGNIKKHKKQQQQKNNKKQQQKKKKKKNKNKNNNNKKKNNKTTTTNKKKKKNKTKEKKQNKTKQTKNKTTTKKQQQQKTTQISVSKMHHFSSLFLKIFYAMLEPNSQKGPKNTVKITTLDR